MLLTGKLSGCAFALPNKKPIHALTYLPKEQWQKLLLQIHDLYQNKQEKAIEYAEKLSNGIVQMSNAPLLINSKNIGRPMLNRTNKLNRRLTKHHSIPDHMIFRYTQLLVQLRNNVHRPL